MIRCDSRYKGERNRQIYEARKAGATLGELADVYGVKKQRISQICEYEEWFAKIRHLKDRKQTLLLIQDLEHKVTTIGIYNRRDKNVETIESLEVLKQKYLNLIEIYSE